MSTRVVQGWVTELFIFASFFLIRDLRLFGKSAKLETCIFAGFVMEPLAIRQKNPLGHRNHSTKVLSAV